jgi:hypothetical protein
LSVFDGILWLMGSKLVVLITWKWRLTVHFEEVTGEILSKWYEVKTVCQRMKLEDLLKCVLLQERFTFISKIIVLLSLLHQLHHPVKEDFMRWNLHKD